MKEGLNNDESENTSFFTKTFNDIKEKWGGLKTWMKCLIISIIVLLIIGVVIIIVIVKNKNDSEPTKEEAMKTISKKEGFVISNDLTENDYVNSYIEATRGEIEDL